MYTTVGVVPPVVTLRLRYLLFSINNDFGHIPNDELKNKFQVPVLRPMELMVEASPRRIFANAHTYHINSISINSDCETYLSADDLRLV